MAFTLKSQQEATSQDVSKNTVIDKNPGKPKGLYETNKRAFVDSTLQANKGLDFVKRLYEKNPKSIQIPGEPGRSTHFMANDGNRVFPTVVNKNNKLQYLGGGNGDEAWDYADKTKEYIEFKTPQQASWFASSTDHSKGYKMGTGVLEGDFTKPNKVIKK